MLTEFIITHDGKNWVVENGLLTVSAPTLEQLDIEVEKCLIRQGLLKRGKKAKVFMAFDNSTIPEWIRPYAQHYFNRIVEVGGLAEE